MLGGKESLWQSCIFLITFLHQVVRSVSSPFNCKLSSLISLVSYLHGNQLNYLRLLFYWEEKKAFSSEPHAVTAFEFLTFFEEQSIKDLASFY